MTTVLEADADVLRRAANIIDPDGIQRSPRHADIEADPATWLTTLFPTYVRHGFAPHQLDFWAWLWAIERRRRPTPRVNIWSRGHAKSTSAELASVALGARGLRRYGLYICRTQDQADDHVQTIANLLESSAVAHWYPALGRPLVGIHGNSKGWRVNRLRTASGFTIDAIGLDTAARGIKLDEQRPDFMVFDDIDHEHDSPATVLKMKQTITQGLLPAGTPDVAVLAVQNLIRSDGVFADLAGMEVPDENGRPVTGPTFLQDRVLSGPIPALIGAAWATDPDTGRVRLTAGEPTWEGFGLPECQEQVTTFGITAFRKECQHDKLTVAGGMFDELDFERCAEAAMPEIMRVAVAVDPAVTDKDTSDACAVQADGLGVDGRIYRLASIERRMSPVAALTTAAVMAIELQADEVVVEDDNGGDTWRSVWKEALERVAAERPDLLVGPMPGFRQVKAGPVGPKVSRAARMVAAYELGWFVHVLGDHDLLEAALHRFPKRKPFDLTDAAFWSARELRPEIDQLQPSKAWRVVA